MQNRGFPFPLLGLILITVLVGSVTTAQVPTASLARVYLPLVVGGSGSQSTPIVPT